MEQEALTCSVFLSLLLVLVRRALVSGADPGIFERGGPEAIIYKILERGCPKSLKMAFECSFQSLSYKSFANIPQKGGGPGPLGPSPKSATEFYCGIQRYLFSVAVGYGRKVTKHT